MPTSTCFQRWKRKVSHLLDSQFSLQHIRRLRQNTSVKDVLYVFTLIVLLYASSVMMFFGGNFWLWSFTPGLKRSYTSIIVPSCLWAIMFIAVLVVHVLVSRVADGGVWVNPFFWVGNREATALLVAIGIFDSLTGLCSLYATVHVPVILQTALISTGPIWTFFIARLLYPVSQRPFSIVLVLVFLCTAGGVSFALVPQILAGRSLGYINPGWIVVYLAATALFPLYNVLQGRFLGKFGESGTDIMTCRLSMLAVETSVQMVATVLYFPLDSLPWFGKCESVSESWDMLQSSLRCIRECRNNAFYLAIYVLGFWIRHLVFAHLNRFSPTIAAITSQLTQPINALLLLVIPSWNVYGAVVDWRFTLGCFLMMLLSMSLYSFWHFSSPPPTIQSRENAYRFNRDNSVTSLLNDDQLNSVVEDDDLYNSDNDN